MVRVRAAPRASHPPAVLSLWTFEPALPPRSIPPPGPTSTRRFRAPWQYITTAAVLDDIRGRGRSLEDLVV